MHKHYLILEGKNTQEIWTTLKDCFQYVFSISTSRILLKMAKNKLLDQKNIYEYTSTYQAAYDQICDLTTENLDLFTKKASILLQAAILFNMGNEYTEIISIIKSEQKNVIIDLESTIFWLVKYEIIGKENEATSTEQCVKTVILLFLTKPAKLENFQALKRSCTNLECVQKNINGSHYTNYCFLKYPELCQP